MQKRMEMCKVIVQIFWFKKIFISLQSFRCDGRAVRHRSAKPGTAVRFRFAPQKARRKALLAFFVAGAARHIFLSGALPLMSFCGGPAPKSPAAFSPFRIFRFAQNTRLGRSAEADFVAPLLHSASGPASADALVGQLLKIFKKFLKNICI